MNLVFDFGAVLFTWQPGLLVQRHFPQHAQDAAAAAALAQGLFGHADWHAFDRGQLALDEVCARSAERLALDPVALGALVASIADHLQPMAGTVEVLSGLHQRRLGDGPRHGLYYLSNMPKPYARTLQARHDFLTWFDGGVFSGDVHHIKPEPAIYQLLQQRHGLVPSETVFIDDLQANVEAARALGWHGIHFQSPAQLAGALASFGL